MSQILRKCEAPQGPTGPTGAPGESVLPEIESGRVLGRGFYGAGLGPVEKLIIGTNLSVTEGTINVRDFRFKLGRVITSNTFFTGDDINTLMVVDSENDIYLTIGAYTFAGADNDVFISIHRKGIGRVFIQTGFPENQILYPTDPVEIFIQHNTVVLACLQVEGIGVVGEYAVYNNIPNAVINQFGGDVILGREGEGEGAVQELEVGDNLYLTDGKLNAKSGVILSSTEPSIVFQGMMYINTRDHKLYIYYGNTFQELHELIPVLYGVLLLENGSNILLESGGLIKLEESA